jgi:hypothetical protein
LGLGKAAVGVGVMIIMIVHKAQESDTKHALASPPLPLVMKEATARKRCGSKGTSGNTSGLKATEVGTGYM